MRIYISADIEGVCGVNNGESTHNKGYLYSEAQEQMTAEVNGAIEGALAAGATEVLVNDSHGWMCNIIPRKLHKAARLIQGSPKPLVMMEGINKDFAAAMFVGYHARNNSIGILAHTISGRAVDNIWVNDILVGETGLNAGIAGYFGVPVVLVVGDDRVGIEAQDTLPNVTTVAVKRAITRYAAEHMHPEMAVDLIREHAKKAVEERGHVKPLQFNTPVTIKLQVGHSGQADSAMNVPGAVRLTGDTLAFTGETYIKAFKGLRAMISMAGV